MSLKLISINIERSKHLDLVIPFLRDAAANVVCVQELMERDIPLLEHELGLRCYFVPSTHHQAEGNPGIEGTAIFANAAARFVVEYYGGQAGEIRMYDSTSAVTKHATQHRYVICGDVEHDGRVFRIATTHFTWTPDGQPDDFQRSDIRAVLSILDSLGEFVICGDFNAPRGGEIFAEFAARYTDNIPPEYTTSIDKNIHRAGDLQLMVDGLFTTPAYSASDVRLVSGVSDHCAISASIDYV